MNPQEQSALLAHHRSTLARVVREREKALWDARRLQAQLDELRHAEDDQIDLLAAKLRVAEAALADEKRAVSVANRNTLRQMNRADAAWKRVREQDREINRLRGRRWSAARQVRAWLNRGAL